MMEKEKFMQEAIAFAETGRGKTSPNPFVGCLIVKQDSIIARGVTQKCGHDHAEVQALKMAGAAAKGAQMYVTLEPCCYVGRTPACSKAIIKAGLSQVFIGITDPNPRVNGGGIAELRAAGIKVETGLCQEEITRQLEYYLLNQTKQRPFVIYKTAMTLDGCTAASDGSSKWITGAEARHKVHLLRSEVDAIITGIGTVLSDDPELNNRVQDDCRQPLRVVLDSNLRIPVQSKLVQTAGEQKTLVISLNQADHQKRDILEELGVEVVLLPNERIDPLAVLNILHKREISSVLLEAGAKLAGSFQKKELIDKYLVFTAPKLLGNGRRIITIPENTNIKDNSKLQFDLFQKIGDDLLITAYPQHKK